MKKLTILLVILTLAGCQSRRKKSADQSVANIGNPKFEFQEEFHNFGKLQAGEVVAYSFHFTNTGDGPLVIERVEKDCGCMEANFPHKPIQAGESDFIEVVFNSAGETGKVYKELIIHSNAEKEEPKLAIAAMVDNEIINLYSKN